MSESVTRPDCDSKTKHKELSAVIKDVHKQLRREFRESKGDHQAVWDSHTQNSVTLVNYAQAMHQLATIHWASHPNTRIEWCRQAALSYFNDGGMQQAIKRDARKRVATLNKSKTNVADDSLRHVDRETIHEDSKAHRNCQFVWNIRPAEGNMELEFPPKKPVNCKLRLLDVGSCYNPFLECPEFESIGIDLSPATKTVYQCDFLKLEITDPSTLPTCQSLLNPPATFETAAADPDSIHSPLVVTLNLDPDPSTSGPVTCLPEESFHIVVFSLLLEYLPAPAQRWMCCVKAQKLLIAHGLLLIVTPDSNSAYRNHPMMRSWRDALGYLGFERWRYQKMEHVHCMAYRKVRQYQPDLVPDSVEHLLYIPQDLSDACYKDDHLPESCLAQTRAANCAVRKGMSLEEQAELESFLLSSAEELPAMGSDNEEEKKEILGDEK